MCPIMYSQKISSSSFLRSCNLSSNRIMVFIMTTVALLATPVFAQQDAGTLRVFVTDSTGAVLRDASVNVTNVATNAILTQPANSDGYAVFAPILRGTYFIGVSKDGFTTVQI